jgi:hypothetical protein
VIIINNNDKKEVNFMKENLSSVPKAKVFKKVENCGFNEEQLNQNLKNYIDCNLDGMLYNENMKK